MPLALETLEFSVTTEQLKQAKIAIDDVAKSMRDLNTAQQEENKSANNSVKAKSTQASTSASATKAIKDEAVAHNTLTEATNKNLTVLERQQSILEFMTQGFSKGQATVLTYAKASGALTDEIRQLEGVLQTQRKLIGGDPFDKSMSGLVALKNQYGEIKEAVRQYNSDTGLTRNQTRELTRDKERIIEKMKLEGAAFSEIRQAIKEYNNAYIEAASKVNALTRVEQERERSAREQANALRFLASAEEKAASMVAVYNSAMTTGDAITERSANSIAAYELRLKQAGITGQEAANRLSAFSTQQKIIAAQEQKQREQYLTRALIPQFSDLFVGFTTGQNPLTVLLQQLPQIQDQFTLTGVQASDTVKLLSSAAGEMATRLKDTFFAVFQGIGLGFVSLGKAIAEGLITPVRLASASLTSLLQGSSVSTEEAFRKVGESMIALSRIVGVTLTGAFAAMSVAIYQAVKANDALIVSINTSGARLGVSSDELIQFAQANAQYGTSVNSLKESLGVLAAEGFKQKAMLGEVTKAAQYYALVTGKSLDEVMKGYAKIGEDPVKALSELAKSQGYVDVAVTKTVQNLIEQGKVTEASTIAIKAYAEAQTKAANDIERSLSPMSKLFTDIKVASSELWNTISNYSNSQPVVDAIRGIAIVVAGLGSALLQVGVAGKFAIDFLDPRKVDAWGEYKKNIAEVQESSKKLIDTLAGVGTKPTDNSQSKTPEQKQRDAESESLRDFIEKQKGLYKDVENLKEQHDKKLAVLFENRKKALSLGDKSAVSDIDDLVKRENAEYNKKLKSFTPKEDTEFKKFEESAKYYQLLGQSDGKAYNESYLKKKEELDALLKGVTSKDGKKKVSITQAEYDKGMDILEKDQPWYKVMLKAEEDTKKLTQAQEDFNRELQKQTDVQVLAIDLKVKDIGLSEEQRYRNEAIKKIEEDRVRNLERINDLVDRSKLQGTALEDYRKKLLQAEQAEYGNRVKLVNDRVDLYLKETMSFESGWDNAYKSYTNSTKNAAEYGKKAFEMLTSGMADMLTEFVTTGKIKVSDFASHFIKELIKIQMQEAASKMVGGSSGLLGSLFSAGASALFGGAGVASGTVGIPTEYTAGSVPGFSSSDLGSGLKMGFSYGGYTGMGAVDEPAGIVHKGEIVWSQSDIANAGGVGVVESMRKGLGGYNNTSDRQTNISKGISVNIENYGTSKEFEVQQISADEIRIIARNEAKNVVQKDAPNVVASHIKNPNSAVSKSLTQNLQSQRRR